MIIMDSDREDTLRYFKSRLFVQKKNSKIIILCQKSNQKKNMILKYLSAEKFKNQDWPFYYVFVNLNFWTKNGLLEHCVAKRGEKIVPLG